MNFIPNVGTWYTKQDHKKKMGFNATVIACIHACVASSSAIRLVGKIFIELIFWDFNFFGNIQCCFFNAQDFKRA